MAFYIYILQCADGGYYTGHTDDMECRLAQHTQGYFRSCYTFSRRPLQLVFCQPLPSRTEALEAERKISGWNRAKKEKLIRGEWSWGQS